MNAAVSGQAGLALLLDGERCSSIHVDAPDERILRQRGDFAYLFHGADDVQFLTDATIADVRCCLGQAREQAEGLQLALIALAPEFPPDVRSEAAGALEELFDTRYVVEHLVRTFYAHELPPSADGQGALAACDLEPAERFRTFLAGLVAQQARIREARLAWEAIPSIVFASEADRQRAHDAAVAANLFKTFVRIRAQGEPADRFRLECQLALEAAQVSNARSIAAAWAEPLAVPAATSTPADYHGLAAELEAETAEDAVPDLDDRTPPAVFAGVESRKGEIVWQMQRGETERALELAENLVEYQVGTGRARHASNSLCAIASEAGKLELPDLQLRLAERSLELNPANGWAHTERGYAWFAMGQLDDALDAFDEGSALGSEYALTGRAEALRAMGRLEEALGCADTAVAEDARRTYSANVRASILRDMGSFDEALRAYDDLIRRSPDDPVAPTGRAEVLRRMGRLDEALTAYNEVIARHPQHVFARTGRAEALKASGRLEEALAAHNETIARHPHNVVARNGRAEALKELGRLEEALAAYEETIARRPRDVVARNGRATVLALMGE